MSPKLPITRFLDDGEERRLTLCSRALGTRLAWAAAMALLALATAAAQQANQAGPAVVLHDPAEYNAYTAALNTQDATARAQALEAFTQQYPRSVVLTDALEQAMAAWQQAGNADKVKEIARRLVTMDAGNVRALAVVVALDRGSAAQGDKASLDELCLYSTAGLREVADWQKPAGMSDGDFASLSRQMNDIFDGAAGFCALQQKNYAQARDFLTRAIGADATNLQDVYQLAVADLEMTPVDTNGFWYCAKAIHLAGSNAQAANGIAAYCKQKYATYHGSADGWDALTAASAGQETLPADFARGIAPAGRR